MAENIFYTTIPPEPLVCTPGDRPDLIPFDPFNEGNSCDLDSAKKHYENVVDTYDSTCEIYTVCDAEKDSFPFEVAPILSDSCKKHFENCSFFEKSIPVVLRDLGSADIPHPMMDLVYHLDFHGIDDFRSGEAIWKTAKDKRFKKLVKKNDDLTMLYPASGAHITPLLIPFRQIDKGRIKSAKIIYTEIDDYSFLRVNRYLHFFESQGLIENLGMETLSDDNPGYAVRYNFSYKGRHVEFIFALDRSHDDADSYYTPAHYIEEADVIIFHDGVQNDVADHFMKELDRLSHIDGAKTRLVLSDNEWSCSRTSGECDIAGRTYQTKYFDGFFGCLGEHSITWWDGGDRFVIGANGMLEIRNNIRDVDGYMPLYHLGINPAKRAFIDTLYFDLWGAILITVEPE